MFCQEFLEVPLYIAVSEDPLGRTNDIIIYEIKTGNIMFRLIHNKRDAISSISYRFDGQRLVSATIEGIITIWDTTNEIEIMTFNTPSRWIKKVSYSPDGNKIMADSLHQIKIWDANDRTELITFPPEQDIFVLIPYASFSQDGTKIVTVGYEGLNRGKVRIHDSNIYNMLYSYDIGNGMMFISNASFVLNSDYIIICYSEIERVNQIVTIMNYNDGNIINTFTYNLYPLVAISPDGRNICYSDNRKDISILRID
jgi:WD40 repeat protein